ncbi:MAG: prepilin-type N-terminal cleavage/methylation domain-containing protein [Candidatus Hydrogenedentes bacterium]|nr:prepilin-type N-terminal cleavage/methylation domain-containing protein [Candidatus Hydrogenedentota bacterium]
MQRRSRNKGLTLTELLVVLAIVGLLGLITVPSFVRFYLDSTDRVRLSAKDLMQIIQTARMYAITYRVNTAVVYSLETSSVETNVVSPTGVLDLGIKSNFNAIKTAAVMYEISSKNNELFYGIKKRLGIPESIQWESFFVPVEPTRLEIGSSHEFHSGIMMCRYEEVDFSGKLVPMLYGVSEVNSSNIMGLSLIRVPLLYLEGKTHAEEKYEDLISRDELDNYTLWYAHVFAPSGRLLVNGPVRERYTFALVDVSYKEPLLVQMNGSYGEDPHLVSHKKVIFELYRSTGVVKVLR